MSAIDELKALIPAATEADAIEPPIQAANDEATAADFPNPDNLPAPVDEAAQAQLKAMVQMLLDTSASLIAPNWDIESAETEALTEALIPVLDKYFPNLGGKIGIEFVLLSTVAMVAAPRIQAGKPMRVEKEINPKKDDAKADAAPKAQSYEQPQAVPTSIKLD